MAIAWKGAKGKARMQISNLTFGGTFPVFPGDGQGSYPKGDECGRPTGGGSCLVVRPSRILRVGRELPSRPT